MLEEEIVTRKDGKVISDMSITNEYCLTIKAKNRPIYTFFNFSPEHTSILSQVTRYALAAGLSEGIPKSIYIINIDAIIKTTMRAIGTQELLDGAYKVFEVS